MAKFRLSSTSVLTIGGDTPPCVVSIDFDESVDDYISDCITQATYKEHVLGLVNVTGTLNFEVDKTGVTALNDVAPRVAGALVFYPTGNVATNISITSTNLQITGRSMAFSGTGLATGSVTFVCDDLTIAAAAGA
jgi:hypothetical protein